MPKRLPYEVAILAVLLLGSCTRNGHTLQDTYDLADVARANASNALAGVEGLNSRAEAVEQKVARLEREMEDRERMEAAIASDLRAFMGQYNRHTH